MKRILLLPPLILLFGFTYGYKNNAQTQKQDLVVIAATPSDVGAPSGSGTSTGINTGDVTLGTVNGLSLAGQVLSLQAATNSVPGALTAADHALLSTALQPYGSQLANYFFAAPNGAPGSPSFRAIVPADVPTLNQSTTGSAAKLTTARAINGVGFDGSTDIQTATAGTSDYFTGTFTPAFVNLTVANGTGGATYAGFYVRIGNMVWWTVKISVTGTCTTSSVAGTTLETGLPPYVPTHENVGSAASYSTGIGIGNGLINSAGFYPPTWTTLNQSIILSGYYQI